MDEINYIPKEGSSIGMFREYFFLVNSLPYKPMLILPKYANRLKKRLVIAPRVCKICLDCSVGRFVSRSRSIVKVSRFVYPVSDLKTSKISYQGRARGNLRDGLRQRQMKKAYWYKYEINSFSSFRMAVKKWQ